MDKTDKDFINNQYENMSFLPKDEKEPEAVNNYMKLDKENENKFRVMGSAITGWELWIDGKPVRKKDGEFTLEELNSADENPFSKTEPKELKTPRYFWAFPVYNYATESIQILELTQATIREGIKGYLEDEDYGKDVTKYDFVIKMNEDGKGYTVRAKPPKDIDEGMVKLYEDMGINLEALLEGADPFSNE